MPNYTPNRPPPYQTPADLWDGIPPLPEGGPNYTGGYSPNPGMEYDFEYESRMIGDAARRGQTAGPYRYPQRQTPANPYTDAGGMSGMSQMQAQQRTMADLKVAASAADVASAKGEAATQVTARTPKKKAATTVQQQAAAPAPGSPAAHRADPDWKQSIMRAASIGDAYSRALLDLVIRARQQATAAKQAGQAPFVPIRDYRGNMMVLVAADGTEFLFDLSNERGSAAYIRALTSAGYDPVQVQQYAEASSRGLAQIATLGAGEFTAGAGEQLHAPGGR